MVSGFTEKGKETGSFNIDEEFFPSDITFDEVPDGVQATVQIQLRTDQTSILEVTFNGTTWVSINNAVGINGLATFTMLVEKTTLLNFRNSDVVGLAVSIVVAA